MKLSDEIIEAMIEAGLVKAIGGQGDEVKRVIATVGSCDEATVILRRGGKDIGVLVMADDSVEGAQARGEATLSHLQ